MTFFFKSNKFLPDRDIPDLTGKVIIVTGGNNGLGKESIRQLAKHNPAKIYMGARNNKKAQAAISDLKSVVPNANIIHFEVDLASFASIQKAAAHFLSENDRLDILMNNAGIFAMPPGLTEDGYEIQFGTNHMGTALLTKLLMPLLEKTASVPGNDVRIVNVSSELYTAAPSGGILLSQEKTTLTEISTTRRYGQSKLANILFTQSCATRYPTVKSVAIHPGVVQTGITDGSKDFNPILMSLIRVFARLAFVSVEVGAHNQLWASTAKPELVRNGGFYHPVGKEITRSDTMSDEKLAQELWAWTEQELKPFDVGSS